MGRVGRPEVANLGGRRGKGNEPDDFIQNTSSIPESYLNLSLLRPDKLSQRPLTEENVISITILLLFFSTLSGLLSLINALGSFYSNPTGVFHPTSPTLILPT